MALVVTILFSNTKLPFDNMSCHMFVQLGTHVFSFLGVLEHVAKSFFDENFANIFDKFLYHVVLCHSMPYHIVNTVLFGSVP